MIRKVLDFKDLTAREVMVPRRHILGIELPSVGELTGRIVKEALIGGAAPATQAHKTMLSAPTSNGTRTLLLYQELSGKRYYDSACLVHNDSTKRCE